MPFIARFGRCIPDVCITARSKLTAFIPYLKLGHGKSADKLRQHRQLGRHFHSFYFCNNQRLFIYFLHSKKDNPSLSFILIGLFPSFSLVDTLFCSYVPCTLHRRWFGATMHSTGIRVGRSLRIKNLPLRPFLNFRSPLQPLLSLHAATFLGISAPPRSRLYLRSALT